MHDYADFLWTSPTELERLALTERPWNYYLETEVWFQTAELAGVVRPVLDGGSERPPLGSLHVISATQPGSEPGNEESTARIAILDAELRTAGIPSIQAVGRSFDGKHQEESRAVFGITDADAQELGLRFGQVAVFSWHGARWSLLACASARSTERGWSWTEDVGNTQIRISDGSTLN
jgi:hypothetical protein